MWVYLFFNCKEKLNNCLLTIIHNHIHNIFMNEREWIDKIKKECILNSGNFDTRYAIQLIGRSGSKLGIVSLNKKFMSVDIIDKLKYERFYDNFYSRNNKETRAPLVIDYHIEHNIGRKGFQELWDYFYKKAKSK